MKIRDAYRLGGPVFSFEFFPPKTEKGAQNLMRTVTDLRDSVQPDFVSVTSGAGGSDRERTHEVVTRIQSDLGITVMAHQTCVGSSREEVRASVKRLVSAGIENVLALRGDAPDDRQASGLSAQGFEHATDLIGFLAAEFELSIGAACYPESHPESPTPEDDLYWTKVKVAQGAGFLISQLFFDNRDYFKFVERARDVGIEVPIIPGIMPITNVGQIERFTKMCGATIPDELSSRLHSVEDDPGAVMATGIEHAITQCRELLERGVPGLHFYTLNKSHATRSILAAVRRLK